MLKIKPSYKILLFFLPPALLYTHLATESQYIWVILDCSFYHAPNLSQGSNFHPNAMILTCFIIAIFININLFPLEWAFINFKYSLI